MLGNGANEAQKLRAAMVYLSTHREFKYCKVALVAQGTSASAAFLAMAARTEPDELECGACPSHGRHMAATSWPSRGRTWLPRRARAHTCIPVHDRVSAHPAPPPRHRYRLRVVSACQPSGQTSLTTSLEGYAQSCVLPVLLSVAEDAEEDAPARRVHAALSTRRVPTELLSVPKTYPRCASRPRTRPTEARREPFRGSSRRRATV